MNWAFRLKQLFIGICNSGTENLEPRRRRPVQYINALSFLTSTLVFSLGAVFFFLVNSLLILIPLMLEGFGMLGVIAFNSKKRYNMANFTMFAIHYVAAGYWTTLLGNAIPIEVVVAFLLIFLTCGSFLVYTEKKVRIYSIIAIVLLLAFIQVNAYFKFIVPIPLSTNAAFIMRLCTTGGMLVFILFVMFAFVKEIELLLGSLKKSNKTLAAHAAFLRETFHELKTPLNSIYGIAQLMQMNLKEPGSNKVTDEQEQEVTNLLAASRLSKDIIDNVLDMKRIEAGKFYDIKKDNIHIRQCIEQCITLNKYIAQMRGISIQFDYKLPGDCISCDEILFKKILNNLISNAVKFAVSPSTVEVTAWAHNSEMYCSVKNLGEIESDKMKSLFEVFASERNTLVEGTGVGLYLVKQLVELLGGQIDVYCKDGATTFSFNMPIEYSTDMPQQVPSSLPNQLPSFDGKKVLVIDDNLMNQQILVRFLQKLGITTQVCRNGKEALVLAVELKPDIIISDMHMPVMDGKEFLVHAKTTPAIAQIPVVIISGDAFNNYNVNEATTLMSLGACAYLGKPLSFSELFTVISTHLPEKLPTC
ncbi:hypothetical protein COR50_19560 [Chitinophaga caeni]|uniref:histidine kinase n=1 Tax=Chitinophaga caeni TaxID=2029983 RepID=A0A291QZ31_9BACT|nr:hybrid sensor histidine kinase/response regulator [Chitinophaga caeni]ATL49195.1 hypothetical protein COR50_19560 [Chitinophaga caeni]